MTVYVGTSGWQYRDWRGPFYPATMPQAAWLPFYAERFGTVEVNSTFYRLPRAETFAAWRERTPPGFVFALKISRYLTHIRRLRDPLDAVERFLRAAAGLREKSGPVLVQLPPNMPLDLSRLEAALEAFPAAQRVAVEFRDDAWYAEPVRAVLSRHAAALCLADRGEEPVTPLWRTAGWGYVRLHWGSGSLAPEYSERALEEWARRIAGLWGEREDVYVFFNNDPGCAAVRDARRMAAALSRFGLATSPVLA